MKNMFIHLRRNRTLLLLSILFLYTAGCSHRPSIRFASQLPKNFKPSTPKSSSSTFMSIPPQKATVDPSNQPAKSAEDTLQYMSSLVGQPYARQNGKSYPKNSVETARAIYDYFGISLGHFSAREEDATEIYKNVQKSGVIDYANVAPLDLIFFDNTSDRNKNGALDDKLTHVGVVEKILPDKTISFVHYMGNSIIRSRMNLQYPDLQHHPQTKERINHLLRRASRKYKNPTSAKLFAGFGRFNLQNQELSSAKDVPSSLDQRP